MPFRSRTSHTTTVLSPDTPRASGSRPGCTSQSPGDSGDSAPGRLPNDSKSCQVENQFPYRQRQPCNHPVAKGGRILPSSILEMKEPWPGERQTERPRPSQGQKPGLRLLASPGSPQVNVNLPKEGWAAAGARGGGEFPPGVGGRQGASSLPGAPRAWVLQAGLGPRVRRKRARRRGPAHTADARQAAAQTLARPSPARPVPLTHSPRPATGAQGGAGPRQGPAVHAAAPARAEVRRGL